MLRITAAILLAFLFIPISFAQEYTLPEKITLHVTDVTFEEAIQQLTANYTISFYFSSSKIPVHHQVTLHAEEMPLNELLDQLCDQAKINYRIKNGQVIFLLSPDSQQAKLYTLSGYVEDSITGERLIGATVIIPHLMKGTTSNAYGFYSYSLPQGTHRIQCSFIGYASVTRLVEINSDQVITFSLSMKSLEINEVKLSSSNANRSVDLKAGTDVVPAKLMSTYPALMGENDVVQFLKMMPGVQTNTEGLNGLYVRGTLPQHSSFIVDDAPMFNMYHFSGWFSTINPDAVKDIRLYKGHLPAKTGGSLGAIVDIRLKDGNNQHFNCTGGIGTLTSRLTIEGPIIRNKASFILSGRRTYFDQLLKLFNVIDEADGLGNFYFYDLNAKVNFTMNHFNRFYISGYAGKDMLKEAGGTSWGNSLISARWNHLFSENTFTNLTLTGSWYEHNFEGYNDNNTMYELTIMLRNYNLKYDLTFFTQSNNRINIGFSARYNRLPPTHLTGKAITLNQKPGDSRPYEQLVSTVYAEGEFDLAARLSADVGLRLNMAEKLYPNDLKARVDPEPVLSLRYAFSEKAVLKTAYSRNYQYYHGASVFEVIIPFDRYLLAGEKLKPQYADHFSAGFFFSQAKDQLEFSVEPYYSMLHNQYRIPISNEAFFNRDTEENPVKGKLKTYGVEISLQKLSGKVYGMMNYTWSKTSKKEEGTFQGHYFHPYYDRRHNFVVSLNYVARPKILLSSNWVFMSGNPYAFPVGKYELRGRSIPELDRNKLYNRRMPDYHRLDISARFGLDRRNPSRHNLSVIIFNVYAKKNPIFYSFSDIADGDIEQDPNRDYQKRLFSMMEFHFFNVFPSISYEFKFGK
jgi:hypothetical protein